MKITCQSCQAKYTIADEKVAGKTVKIKCKKCGAAIVVQGTGDQPQGGYDAGYPPPADGDDGAETRVFGEQAGAGPQTGADEWMVNVAEGDERTMTTAQLATEYSRGALSNDTYVWREGMSDWLPIGSVPELAHYVSAQAPAAAGGHGLMGTVVMDSAPQGALSPAAPRPLSSPPQAARPASAPPAAAAAPAPAAARRAGNRGGVDVFGERGDAGAAAAAAAGPPGDRLIGERNENSVLFSLSALTAAETATKASSKSNDAVLDLRPSPPARNNGRVGGGGGGGGFDDIMNLGGGGLGSPILAPPPLLAPVVEAPPPPPSMHPAMPMSMAPMAPDMPQKKSRTGLIVGIVVGVLAIGGVGFAAMGVFSSKPPEGTTTEQAAAPTTTAAVTAAPTTVAAAPTETAAAAPAETAKPADTAVAVAAGPTPGGPKPGSPTPGSPTPGSPTPGKTAEAKEPDKPPPPPEKTAEPPPPSGGSNEFNRGAATSALGGAAGAAKSCKKPDGPTGSGKVKVTFAPSGNVTSAQVQGPPFAGTPVGGCVAGVFRGARVPPFDGAPVTVTKSFNIN